MSKVVQPLRLIDFSVLFFVMFFKKLKYELITHAKPISLDSNVSLTLLILFFYFATVIWLFFFSTVQYQIFEIHHVKIYELPCTYITFQKKNPNFYFQKRPVTSQLKYEPITNAWAIEHPTKYSHFTPWNVFRFWCVSSALVVVN